MPTGGKLWWLKYRQNGKERLMSFGPYPEVSIAQAREAGYEARKVIAAGCAPMALRQANKTKQLQAAEKSFASIARRWLSSNRNSA